MLAMYTLLYFITADFMNRYNDQLLQFFYTID